MFFLVLIKGNFDLIKFWQHVWGLLKCWGLCLAQHVWPFLNPVMTIKIRNGKQIRWNCMQLSKSASPWWCGKANETLAVGHHWRHWHPTVSASDADLASAAADAAAHHLRKVSLAARRRRRKWLLWGVEFACGYGDGVGTKEHLEDVMDCGFVSGQQRAPLTHSLTRSLNQSVIIIRKKLQAPVH